MATQTPWIIDTDIQLHRRLGDSAVARAAQNLVDGHRPAALAGFSRLELKGNYFQDLLLLRNKIEDSDCLKDAVARVMVTGNRRSARMMLQFADALEVNLDASWPAVQSKLLVHLDTQLLVCWEEFIADVDELVDDLKCTRAAEAPCLKGEGWHAAIPRCKPGNTTCRVVEMMRDHRSSLRNLVDALSSEEKLSSELERILAAAREVVEDNRFSWQGVACRKIGDLLIGLHAITRQGIVSSNDKEHCLLGEALGYDFARFPVAAARLK